MYILIIEAPARNFTRQTNAKRKDVTMNNTKKTAVENTAKNEKRNIVRMEGIAETAKLFGLPKNLIRQLVLSGKVKSVRVSESRNAKIFVNIDSVNEYFNTHTLCEDEDEKPAVNGIKPIPVRL